jgi:Fur family peroxide stress response transcriptional regulator
MDRTADFRALCRRHGLAATHQRQLIYETLMSLTGHPSPEMVYERVRRKIPSISLATVYKNLHTFVERGVLREVSLHHGSLRVDANHEPHHHAVCMKCKSIVDIQEEALTPIRLRGAPPAGFQVERFAVDVLGICAACAARSHRPRKTASPFDHQS